MLDPAFPFWIVPIHIRCQESLDTTVKVVVRPSLDHTLWELSALGLSYLINRNMNVIVTCISSLGRPNSHKYHVSNPPINPVEKMFQFDQESPDFMKGKESIMNLKIHFNLFLFQMWIVVGNTVFAIETVFCQNLSQIKKICISSEYSKGVLLTSS